MAKEPTTPKKAIKPVKAGILKRTPVKVSPAKTSSTAADKELVFLWKCVKMSSGMKIDWSAIATDAGKSVNTVQKQWSRLNIKMEKIVSAATANDSDKDVDEDSDGDLVAASNDSE
ncbi:hypothetical protein Pdw03_4778 [Penicillium digitatum]|nr:hypothetical protein PDIDSM_6101 [Penicillium digitatum]QQK41924.1 hypothetical protein Pdw03_4778 [Penicillium digitatum]